MQQGRTTRRGRRRGDDAVVAVLAHQRCALADADALQVFCHPDAAIGAHTRQQAPRGFAAAKLRSTLGGQTLQSRREIGLLQHRARRQRHAAGCKHGECSGVHALGVVANLAGQAGIHHEAFARDADGGLQQQRQRQAAVALRGVLQEGRLVRNGRGLGPGDGGHALDLAVRSPVEIGMRG